MFKKIPKVKDKFAIDHSNDIGGPVYHSDSWAQKKFANRVGIKSVSNLYNGIVLINLYPGYCIENQYGKHQAGMRREWSGDVNITFCYCVVCKEKIVGHLLEHDGALPYYLPEDWKDAYVK